ncbi:hypothetical protein FNV43_RR16482 [Rhamnella rubrinervis]|uniref:Cyclin-dependent kinase inhibitor n=1 Tax=Rhamnella rubrinervis TaxID=2594499 RepID=A0A8K0MD96_9ROSA|nr:hypothetical protein FNV43_RR16482 [Rhamnella rubrinervis]
MAPTTTRSHSKQQMVAAKEKETSIEMLGGRSVSSSEASPSRFVEDINEAVEGLASATCSTPKAKRFKIPELLSCPPAPKKRRVASNYSSTRSPKAFFAPPDLELFFFFALRNSTPASLAYLHNDN